MDADIRDPTQAHHESAVHRTFATPELLECILICTLDRIQPLHYREDPRSVRAHTNARILLQLLSYSTVNKAWYNCIKRDSITLRRALFLSPEPANKSFPRSWTINNNTARIVDKCFQPPADRHPTSYFQSASSNPPHLNPIIQTTFPKYHFRFWHLPPTVTQNKYCAFLIVRRSAIESIGQRRRDYDNSVQQGRAISNMLLSQPPCTQLEAKVWEEIPETTEYVDRTSEIREPIIRCETGLRLGQVHARVAEMFGVHLDVMAIKLTTV